MAKLENSPYPGNWEFSPATGEAFDDYNKRTSKMLNEIPQKIYLPYADGNAIYAVKSIKPPVLQWIPYGDAWQVPFAHIRGLRSDDIQQMLKRDKDMKVLFS